MKANWHEIAVNVHNQYVKRAQAKGNLNSEQEIVRFLALAICGEAGELANLIKKAWRGDEIDKQMLRDEIADIRIYLEHLARHLAIDIDRACDCKLEEVSRRISSDEHGIREL